ncbi:WYL domain-containing protein [Candidatus Avelusimicrobium alvi]|jgi:hypothetical protein|uniref:WYL domain-containing protein n=1 Tax=Candidatus Avelusimicrobium alvi TaxID=3416221 RepID=UPI003D0F7152
MSCANIFYWFHNSEREVREVLKGQAIQGRERDEKEVKGYFNALDEVAVLANKHTVTETDIKTLHGLIIGNNTPTPYRAEQNVEIKLKIAPSIAGYFKEVEFFPYQKIEKELKDGSLLISCKTANFMQVLPQIQRWLPHIEVISPHELARTLHEQLENYLQQMS